MNKKLLILAASALVISACGGKGSSENMSPQEIVRQSLANYNQSCVDKTLMKTKSKINESDRLAKSGDNAGAVKAEEEAVELFKTEDVKYRQAEDGVNAQSARYDEAVSRKNNLAANPNIAKSKQWAKTSDKVDRHLANAKKAMDNCDPDKAKAELDAANALLSEMERLAGVGGGSSSGNNTVYIVKKGDNLWNIAGKQYSNPFMWPIIYWTNQQKIKDPDLIFPKQQFKIVFDSSAGEKSKAERLAKTRGPWSLYDNK